MESNSNPSNSIDEQSILNIEVYSIYSSLSEEIQKLLNYTNGCYFICKECKTIPLLQFENLSKILVSCECSKNVPVNITDLKKNFIIDKEFDNISEIESNLKCIEHKNNYKYYCLNHNINLCETCQKIHNCDNVKNFEEEKYNLDKDIIPFIGKSLMNENIKNFNDLDDKQISNNVIEYLTNLLSILLNNYYFNPNYNIIVNIKNFYSKLKSVDDSEKKNYEIENNIEIKSLKQYKKVNYNQKKYITKIEINSKNFDICYLKNEKLINLIELNLPSNNIYNIEQLTTADFNILEILNLSINRLDDSMIEVISILNLKNLRILDLSYNYFTQFQLFKSIEHFKNLKITKFGSNKFTEDIEAIMKDKSFEFNLQSLKEMYLFNGVFSNKSIKIISKFLFEKLEILDLTSNNLTSLSFIDDLKYIKEENNKYQFIKNMNDYPLKKLILTNNDISDIDKLLNLKKLEEVELINNSIIINQSLNGIVKNMKSLEVILLFGNKKET